MHDKKLIDDDEIFWSGESKWLMPVIAVVGTAMVLYFGAHLVVFLLR